MPIRCGLKNEFKQDTGGLKINTLIELQKMELGLEKTYFFGEYLVALISYYAHNIHVNSFSCFF